jgi:hypothetical protein
MRQYLGIYNNNFYLKINKKIKSNSIIAVDRMFGQKIKVLESYKGLYKCELYEASSTDYLLEGNLKEGVEFLILK